MNQDQASFLHCPELWRFAHGWGWMLALLCATLAGCTPDGPVPVDVTTQHVLENARTINAGLTPAIDSGGDVYIYLNAVGSRLYNAALASNGGKDAIQWPIQVDLLANDVPLAFTVGGEHVYISTGALRLCGSEEDLAAALAHLYAHILDKHQQKHQQLDSQDLISVADVVLGSPPGQDEEQAADLDGYLLFARAGWDPGRYADAWLRLGGVNGAMRTIAIRRSIEDMSPPSDDWRRPPVADRYSFHRIVQMAGSVPNRSDDAAKLLMRCVKSCVGTDNSSDRAAAIASVEAQIPTATEGGGRTQIGPRPVGGL
jgi:hypothetical protein